MPGKTVMNVTVVLIVMFSMLLAACTPQPAAAPAAAAPTSAPATGGAVAAPAALPDVIKIGVNETMTGWGAPYGDMTWKGIQLANKNRGTVLGKKVELVLVDNKSEKSESAIAAQRLVEVEKVAAVLGVNSSSMAMAQNEVLDKVKIVSICGACTNPLVTQGKSYAFRAAFIDPFQGDAGAKFAVNELKAKTAVLLVDITLDYPVGLSNYFRQSFLKYTGNEKAVLASFSFQTGDRDFTAQLTQIKALNPDIIFAPNEYAEEAAILQQAKQLGITSKFLAGDSADVPELAQIAKENANGFMYTAQFHADAYTTPEAKAFIEGFRKAYNIDPETFSVTGYDSYMMLLDGIERAGSLDSDAIKKGLEQGNLVGARGTVNLDANHNAVVSLPVIEIVDGKKTFRALIQP